MFYHARTFGFLTVFVSVLFGVTGICQAQNCSDFQFGDASTQIGLDYNGRSWEFEVQNFFQVSVLKTALRLWGTGSVTIRVYHNNDTMAMWSHTVTNTPTDYAHTETLNSPESVNINDWFALFAYTSDNVYISGPNEFSACDSETTVNDPPSVVESAPQSGSTDIPINTKFQAYFSEEIAPGTMNVNSFTVTPEGGIVIPVTVTLGDDNKTATLTPVNDLQPNTTYTARLTSEVTDLTGKPMPQDHVWQVTTGASRDVTPPVVTSIYPPDGATNVPRDPVITINFNEPMDRNHLNENNIQLIDADGNAVRINLVYYLEDSQLLVFMTNVDNQLQTFAIHLSPEIADLAGNMTGININSTFTTEGRNSHSAGCFLSGCK